MKKVVLATNNKNKVAEITAALDFDGWQFCTLAEAGLDCDPDENAATFEGNARIKAACAHEASGGMAALADDSGLIVDALDGAPGVFSARYAGADATDAANNAKLLRELEGVPAPARTARFACTLVFIDEDGTECVAEGFVEGKIGFAESGQGGFGYDPLFFPDDAGGQVTFAQLSQAEKTSISHRGRALLALKAKLQK